MKVYANLWRKVQARFLEHVFDQANRDLVSRVAILDRIAMKTGETPRPYGVEPSRPRVEAVRIVDMSESNRGQSSPASSAQLARPSSTMSGPSLSSKP
jgi:hypothetical protein